MLIRNKFNGFTADGTRRFEISTGGGGGGGSPAPTSYSQSQTTIPSYAQPYVETMLGQAQALTSTPYQQYGGQRVAGFTPLQTQAMGNIGTMQVAPQLGQATDYATQAGAGMLGTTDQAGKYGQYGIGYGGMGAGLGLQAAGAGDRYAAQATNPYAVQAYMNPYVQASLAPQMQLLNQQQALAGANIAAGAAGRGAFGGNRTTLAQGLNAQNYDLARQQAIGQGYNEAFRQAQQAQQFGAGLGLQGLQTGIQGAQAGMQGAALGLQGIAAQQAGYAGANQAAANLGQLGQTQYGQQMGINQAQLQAGAMQQALQQQGLDVAYQNFLKQQNYPYQQLGFMSDMLRGLPLSQSAQQIYTAPPSFGSQLGGLGMTGLGIYGMSGGFRSPTVNVKSGGLMAAKAYKEGGKINYDVGGDIKLMKTEQLQELLGNPTLTPMEQMMVEKQLMLRERIENNPESSAIIGGGLDTAPSGDLFHAAGGGIVAFAGEDGSLVKTKEYSSTPKPIRSKILNYQDWLEDQVRSSMEEEQGNPYAKSAAMQEEYAKEMKERREMRPWETLTALGVGTLSGKSQYPLENLGLGGVYALQQQQKAAAEDLADRRLMLQQQVEAEKSADARKTARQNAMQSHLGQMYSREIGLKNVAASAASTAASKANTEYNKNWNNFQTRVQAEKNLLIQDKSKTFDYEQNPYKLDIDAYKNVYLKTPPDIRKQLDLEDPVNYGKAASGETAKPTAPAGTLGANAPSPVKPVINPDGTVTIPSGPKKGTYQPQPDGTYKLIKTQ